MDRLAARPASRPRPPSHPNTESLTRDSADTGTGHAGAFAAESPVTAQVAKTHPDLASAVRSFGVSGVGLDMAYHGQRGGL